MGLLNSTTTSIAVDTVAARANGARCAMPDRLPFDGYQIIDMRTGAGPGLLVDRAGLPAAVIINYDDHQALLAAAKGHTPQTNGAALTSSERDELRLLRWQVARLRGLAGAVLDKRGNAERELRAFLTQIGTS